MRRAIFAIFSALFVTSTVAVAEPRCSTVYGNKPCDQPTSFDPQPSKGDQYVKSQFGTHISSPKRDSHVGARAGYGYHQVVYHHQTTSHGSSKSAGGKASASHPTSTSR